MNKHCGRWVFSKIRGCLMVVAEAAKGQGKGGGARGERSRAPVGGASGTVRLVNTLALSAMLTQSLLQPLQAVAQIRADNTAPGAQRPTVLTTGNGLPQVNITTPSAAGVSRNRLSQMDVDSRGAVVNNSRTHTPTQIGGWVQGNPWLATGEARVILLEVNSQNPSQINGFIEIAGQRSEIIVANPAGLNVNGSGFINASRATLTTGEVNLNDAGVSGYTVRGGTITIGSQGFDASLTDYTGILARAVAVNGPVRANQLNVVTGANQIEADGQGAAPTAGSGPAPSFALDVSQLGGMYAGKITLLATEAGVGVRNAGGVQAGSGGLSLSANGDLVNQGSLASQGSASLNSSGRFDNSGSLSAAAALNVQSTGSVTNSGQLRSGGALTLQTAADLANSGQIGAGTEATIVAAGRLDNTGGMSAGTHLSLQGAQLSNAGSLNAGQLLSLSSAGRFDNAGEIVVQGSVQLVAPQGMANTGSIQSQKDITLSTGADVINSGSVVADGALAIQAGTTVTNTGSLMGDQGVSIQTPQVIENRGHILSGAQTTLSATESIHNHSLIVGDGGMQLESGQRIHNHSDAQIYAGGNLQAQTGQAILNEGRIGANGDIRIETLAADGRIHSTAGSVLSAGMDPAGAVPLGKGSLSLHGGSAGAIDLKGLTLAGQSIQAQAGSLNLNGQDLLTQRMDLQASQGDLLAQGSSLQAVQQLRLDAAGELRTDNATLGATQLDVTASEWNLQGSQLQQVGTADQDARIQVGQRIDASSATLAVNAGSLTLSSQELQLDHTTLTHSGTGALVLQSQGPQTVVADDALLITGGSLQLDAAALQASRSLVTAQTDAQLNVQGAMAATEATLVANGALGISAGSLSADKADLVGVDGGATLNIAGAASLREGSVQSRANIGISAQSLDSTQGLISGQDIGIDTHGGALGNADGAILAARHLNIASGAIDNQRGVLQGGGNASVAASGAVNNQGGQILAGGTLSLSSSDTVDNRNASGVRAAIAATTGLSITSQGLNNQGSDIKSAAALQIHADAGAVDNSQAGLIAASGALDLRGGALNNSQTAGVSQGIQAQSVNLDVHSLDNRHGALLAQNQLAVNASGTLDNTGGLLSSTGTLSITDPQAAANPAAKTLALTNGAGGVIAANGATAIDARSLDNSGVIANAGDGSDGGGDLRIALSGALVNRAGGFVQAADSLIATAASASNAGTLEAANELHLAAGSIHNQATGAVRAGLIDLQAGSLSNQGLVNGSFTLIQAGAVTNSSGGRIYGDQISIAANQLNNQGGAGTDPVIASRGDLDLGVGVVSNSEGALLLSLGHTRVGGSLDANARATGSAGAFINSSAEVEVFGNLTINAASVQNVDAHGNSYNRTTTEDVVEYRIDDVYLTRNPADTRLNPNHDVPLNANDGEMDWRWHNDNQKHAYFVPNDGSEQIKGEWWWTDRYTRTITESGTSGRDPARISVGGNMSVNAGSTVNDKSSILIGGNFLLTGGSLQNIDGYRSREVTEVGTTQLSYTEERWYDWEQHHRRFMDEPVERVFVKQTEYEAISAELDFHTNPNHGSARPQAAQAVSVASLASAPTATTATGLSGTPGGVLGQPGPGVVVRTLPSGLGSGGHVTGSGATAASSVNAPPISLPSNALFQVRIGAPAGYLVETDPEFTLQRRWLGSDYMLAQLDYDPATQTQRLGDGFYEQKLVREQVAQLTGRRFLGTFTDDEAQYRALLEAGAAFAQAYQLKPGIALTGAQMALLTSDIVWLVERTVQLPDGRSQRVLVPQLYALVDRKTGTLQPGLISAKGTTINLSGGLFNSGTLAARDNLAINAGSITNVLGQMQGNNVDLRASGGITSILGQIAARQNLNMKAGGDMVFVGGGIKAGGNARLSAGGDLQLLAYDTGKQVRAQSPRDENGKPVGKGPVWSFENSTYNQTGVDINVGGSLSARAGGNLVAQGVNANVGGSTSLRAGGDMQLTTALQGHVNSFNFYNKYKSAGDLLKISQRINRRDIDLQNSGNNWSSGGGVNLSAGNNLSLVGAQINSQGYSASAGGSYQERAAYDVKENVKIETIKRTGLGVYLADATNNTLAIATLGAQGGKTEKDRTETHIDSTRTAIVTDINAGAGAVNRNAGGDVLIEGSRVSGGVVNALTAGGTVTAVAAVDTRHVEDSTFTSTIRWQSTKSTGSIEQTLHMPQIHGLPANMSAYQGAGGVSVQLPAGSNVRTAIETLSQKPGQGYLKELGNRSDIDWQRVEELNKSLDFSKSGLTQEATIVVIIVVSILTYGAASSAGGAAATATGSSAVGAAVTAGTTSLASTAAVSLINNKGDIGATLKELGSSENAKGLLLTMATAGLSNGILNQVGLSGVDANSTVGQLFAKNAIQGITSAVLESAVMGTNLEDALKNNLKGALINTVAAQGADEIGDAKLDATSKALAHALLGCAMGAATAGSSSGCAPGATGAVIGEIVAGLYGDSQDLGGLEEKLKNDPNNESLKQQIAQIRNTVTELAKLTGAGGALLIGGDAGTMQIAMGTAQNAAVNNYLNHAQAANLNREMTSCNQQAGGCSFEEERAIRDRYIALSNENIAEVQEAIVAGDAEQVQRLLSTAAPASAIEGVFSSRWDEQILVGRQNNVNNFGSVKGDGAYGSDVEIALGVQAYRQDNCEGLSGAACNQMVEQALNDQATRGWLLAGVTGAVPLTFKGVGGLRWTKPVAANAPSTSSSQAGAAAEKPAINQPPGAASGTVGGANSAPRIFTSSDPIVGQTATTIDQVLPGAVKDVNVPIKNTNIGLSSDADIMLKNGDVIEVKSGGGKGATTQVANQTKIIGSSGEVIVYGPDLKPSVIKGIQSSGTKVFGNLDDLLAYIKSKGL